MARKVKAAQSGAAEQRELVIITGLSGSGKGTVLKVLEDLGFYSVDNLPLELMPKFAELTSVSPNIRRAALVVDIREGASLKRFPAIYRNLQKDLRTKLIFLEAADDMLVRRFSETRRPHPLGTSSTVGQSIEAERKALAPIRALADFTIDTSKFTVHQLRDAVKERFGSSQKDGGFMIQVTSFGFRNGIPSDSDLVFDVRFLPNPNYIPEFKPLTGRHPRVARYVGSFPQTQEFIQRISDLLQYLLPHYIREGKSYLTISFGCTGGQHRSVMMAGEFRKRLEKAGYRVKETHRDMPR
jgi:RNase adapter protein RapZ